MRSGFVGLIGRPNVGKSTLINGIIGKKVVITSNKPQTTRNLIQAIYNEDDTQIVFVDTPGIHKPNTKLGDYLNKQSYYSINDVDVILFLVDASEYMGKGDQFILEKLKNTEVPVILVLNKIDKLKKEEILIKISEYKDLYNFSDIVPVSGLKSNNTKELIKVIKNYLPDEVRYFDDNQLTNRSLDFLIAEIVREKIFRLTEEEVPHSITTQVRSIEKNNNAFNILVDIIVERDSLKGIIIGKQGEMIKKIGVQAREDIENLLGKKVYLELFVRVVKKWRDKEKYLAELGFNELD